MTVQELMIELEQMNPNCEIRFASQPAWPFEYSVDGVVLVCESEEEDPDFFENDRDVVYLVEGAQLGYLPEEARNEIGW